MLSIRLQRTGRTNDPHFRVVVGEHTMAPSAGSYLEKLGSYNPKTKERILDTERIEHWMKMGAKPSPTMHNMLVSAGVLKKPKINVLPKRKILAKREAEKKEAAEKASAEEAKNTPAGEVETAPEAPAEPAPVAEEKKEEPTLAAETPVA